jgi:uncharacterized protein YbcI
MDGAGPLSGGELNAAVAREVVRVHTESLGRGPEKSFAFYSGNLVIAVLEGAMTRAERSLAENGEAETVLSLRRLFQRTMADEMKAAVELLTGRTVVAFMSDNHIAPDLAVEIFVLDGMPAVDPPDIER